MLNELLKEQDLRTGTPQRCCKEQLRASTRLVWPASSRRCARRHRPLTRRFGTSNGAGSGAAARPKAGGRWPCRGCPAPTLRCAGRRAPRPATATLSAACGLQRSTFHRVQVLPGACVGLFSTAGAAVLGPLVPLFLPVLATLMRETPWPARCCAANCVQPAAFLLARNEPPGPGPPVGSSLGSHNSCTDSWAGPHCCRFCAHVRGNNARTSEL